MHERPGILASVVVLAGRGHSPPCTVAVLSRARLLRALGCLPGLRPATAPTAMPPLPRASSLGFRQGALNNPSSLSHTLPPCSPVLHGRQEQRCLRVQAVRPAHRVPPVRRRHQALVRPRQGARLPCTCVCLRFVRTACPLPQPCWHAPPTPPRRQPKMRVLNNGPDGALQYNRCTTCDLALKCRTALDCAPTTPAGLPGCTKCGFGFYPKAVDVSTYSAGGPVTTAYQGCASCAESEWKCAPNTACDASERREARGAGVAAGISCNCWYRELVQLAQRIGAPRPEALLLPVCSHSLPRQPAASCAPSTASCTASAPSTSAPPVRGRGRGCWRREDGRRAPGDSRRPCIPAGKLARQFPRQIPSSLHPVQARSCRGPGASSATQTAGARPAPRWEVWGDWGELGRRHGAQPSGPAAHHPAHAQPLTRGPKPL